MVLQNINQESQILIEIRQGKIVQKFKKNLFYLEHLELNYISYEPILLSEHILLGVVTKLLFKESENQIDKSHSEKNLKREMKSS